MVGWANAPLDGVRNGGREAAIPVTYEAISAFSALGTFVVILATVLHLFQDPHLHDLIDFVRTDLPNLMENPEFVAGLERIPVHRKQHPEYHLAEWVLSFQSPYAGVRARVRTPGARRSRGHRHCTNDALLNQRWRWSRRVRRLAITQVSSI